MQVFFYGTLCHAPLLECVLGHASGARSVPARLEGHATVWADGESFPLLTPRPGAQAEGVLASGLRDAELARLDYYEAVFGYAPREVTVMTEGGPVPARVWMPAPDQWTPGAPWSLRDWVKQWGEMTCHAAAEIMSYYPDLPAAEIPARVNMIRVRADSRVRAARGLPATLRHAPGAGDLDIRATRRPYANFFTVEEHDLAFRRFDGSLSEQVTRAGFVMGDAVTVLPYDPVRDRVMVIEQFRFGPHLRGDPTCWMLEAIAGRIDPGEDPADTARREAMEEAGLDLGALHHVADYYPSPGAISEMVYSYVGLADLPEDAAGLGGVAHEVEDIRSHVIPFARLMELVASGEAGCGPLVLTAFWLAQNRDRLRAGA